MRCLALDQMIPPRTQPPFEQVGASAFAVSRLLPMKSRFRVESGRCFWKLEIFERVNSPRRKRAAKERIWLTDLRAQATFGQFLDAWRSRV